MKSLSLAIVLLGGLQIVHAITVSSPAKGQKVDMKQGLTVSWSLDNNDNKSANVTIDLFIGDEFYLLLTPKAGVPVNDMSYTYQYTSPNYIDAHDKYIVRLFDGSGKESSSDIFSIFDTEDFVQATSTVKTKTYLKTAGTQNGTPFPSPSPSPSSSGSTSPTTIQTHTSTPTPTASQNAGRHGYGDNEVRFSMEIAVGLIGLVVLGFAG